MAKYEVQERKKVIEIPYEVITVEHRGNDLNFATSAFGPGDFYSLREKIDSSKLGLVMPTLEETVSLVHSAIENKDKRHTKDILKILDKNWFYANNAITYVPHEGMYVEDNPKVKDGKVILNKEIARFAPFGYKIGSMSPLELEKNQGVIALVGEEGAEKLAQIAHKYISNPRFWSFDSTDKEVVMVPALGDFWSVGGRLGVGVGGVFLGYDVGGCAFGVLSSCEASTPKNKG